MQGSQHVPGGPDVPPRQIVPVTTTGCGRSALTLAASAALVAAVVTPAQAQTRLHGTGHQSPAATRVAAGLDNPRQLSFSWTGDLYVAESGRGGTGPCQAGPEGDEVCFGSTGAVTRVTHRGTQSRVVTGLPSLAGRDGSSASGPSDVEPLGGRSLAVLLGLGANPADRAGMPAAAARLGTLQLARVGSNRTWTLADLAAHEARENPVADPDSNPSSVVLSGGKFWVTDAGGNDLVSADWRGRTRTVATFPDQLAVAPPFLGLPPGTRIPAQAVPTAVVRGPDGAFYVSQLTGFPFEPGLAKIYRVVPGHAPTVWASGLTNVTSLAFDRDGRLYAVQLADAGLLAVPEGQLPQGSLVRVPRGSTSPVTVKAGLAAPYGVAVRGSSAYVTTCSVCAGGGEVWRVALPR